MKIMKQIVEVSYDEFMMACETSKYRVDSQCVQKAKCVKEKPAPPTESNPLAAIYASKCSESDSAKSTHPVANMAKLNSRHGKIPNLSVRMPQIKTETRVPNAPMV